MIVLECTGKSIHDFVINLKMPQFTKYLIIGFWKPPDTLGSALREHHHLGKTYTLKTLFPGGR